MKETYKGAEIEYLEHTEMFYVVHADYSNKSLKKCREYINKAEKEGFERVGVLVGEWGRGEQVKKAIVTSICSDDPKYCWVVYPSGQREKASMERVYLDTEATKNSLDEIKGIEKQIQVLDKKIGSIRAAIERPKSE